MLYSKKFENIIAPFRIANQTATHHSVTWPTLTGEPSARTSPISARINPLHQSFSINRLRLLSPQSGPCRRQVGCSALAGLVNLCHEKNVAAVMIVEINVASASHQFMRSLSTSGAQTSYIHHHTGHLTCPITGQSSSYAFSHRIFHPSVLDKLVSMIINKCFLCLFSNITTV